MSRQKIIAATRDLEQAIAREPSLNAAAKSLGMKYATFKRRCIESDVPIITNQGGKGLRKGEVRPLHEMKRKGSIKRRMLERGTPNECAMCKTPPTWFGKPLSLHLDHIDGDRTNNSADNLRLLCPNCHSQTPTWGVKNAKFMRDKANMAELVDAQGSEPCG